MRHELSKNKDHFCLVSIANIPHGQYRKPLRGGTGLGSGSHSCTPTLSVVHTGRGGLHLDLSTPYTPSPSGLLVFLQWQLFPLPHLGLLLSFL